jgi:hypothetical protein
MAYQVKTITYRAASRKILLQNINGPCPLLAAANALLLRGVISLSGECTRSGVASTDDVVNMLAGWAIERSSRHNTSSEQPSDHEYHLNEVLSLLPSLQHGMDVNPKFNSPTGVEYTNNLAAFDSLGIELVHGWLFDPTEEVAELIGNKSYNELVELVIVGSDAVEEIRKMNALLFTLEERLKASDGIHENIEITANNAGDVYAAKDSNECHNAGRLDEITGCSFSEQSANENDEDSHPTADQGASSEATNGMDDVADKRDNCNTSNEQSNVEDLNAVSNEISEVPKESRTNDDEAGSANTGKDACNEKCAIIKDNEIPDNKLDDCDSQNIASAKEGGVYLQKEIDDLRAKIKKHTELLAKSQIVNDFLTKSSHQLTYHGLERLQTHLSEDDLCVFFRNNHFGTLTKHNNTLYLLVTDLGYANTPDIVWEKLDTIDGDTEYTNEVFGRPKVREDLTPASGPTINPELLLAQRSQAESDYALALALSEGRATSERLNDDESKLIAAATEESLKSYHCQNGTGAVNNHVDKRTQIDIDREVALAFQKEEQKIDHESEMMARRLQEMEYAQRQQPAPNRANRPARPKNPTPSSGNNPASGSCTVS